MLVDVDVGIGNRRLTIAGRVRPLDDLSLKLLLDRLEHRRARWPNTANLHLLINNQTANKTTGRRQSLDQRRDARPDRDAGEAPRRPPTRRGRRPKAP
ncbi:hypothetical protein ACFV8Z_28635 [Streptomyces sp. NPDC059837]|uniref:hypothetical protein n=1 Tax=unclassified Streptomyces TaxID=2593676 RepID=UPI003660991A